MSAPILTPGEVTGQLVERIAALESDLAHAVESYHREKEDRRELQRQCDNLKLALDAETNKCVGLRRKLTDIDKLTCNCPCMSLQAQHEFERHAESEAYRVELCKVILAIREQARAALRDRRAE